MVQDAYLFCRFAQVLSGAAAEGASPKLCFEEIARAWKPIADLLVIGEEVALLVVVPLETATCSYEHDRALHAWATRAAALLSRDMSVDALRCVANELPVPHVHRARLDPRKLGPSAPQLYLFYPPQPSG